MLTIGAVAIPELKPMSLSAMAVFQVANGVAGEPAYDRRLISEAGGLVQTNAGLAARGRQGADAPRLPAGAQSDPAGDPARSAARQTPP